ncbi:hypothetical protein BC833DRAFT_607758 [Globomyces pollinis-pini]|nr:hypothetical protein BC833DRAFT_607758 [Globomyces pollinis-pini]
MLLEQVKEFQQWKHFKETLPDIKSSNFIEYSEWNVAAKVIKEFCVIEIGLIEDLGCFQDFKDLPNLHTIISNGIISPIMIHCIPKNINCFVFHSILPLDLEEANTLGQLLSLIPCLNNLTIALNLDNNVETSTILSDCLSNVSTLTNLFIAFENFPKLRDELFSDFILSNRKLKVLQIAGFSNDFYSVNFPKFNYLLELEELQAWIEFGIEIDFNSLNNLISRNKILKILSVSILTDDNHWIPQLSKSIIDGLQANTTLAELRLDVYDTLSWNLFEQATNQIHSVNPSLVISHELFDLFPKLDLNIQESEVRNLQAQNLVFARFHLMMLSSLYSSDIIQLVFSCFLQYYQLDKSLLLNVLLDKKSMGLLVTRSRNPFDASELIRCCYRYYYSNLGLVGR